MKKAKKYLLLLIFIIVFSLYLPETVVAMEADAESGIEPVSVLPLPPEPVEVPESSAEPDGISSAAELTGWLESHKYTGGRAALTGDITMNEPYMFVPDPNMPPLLVETGKYTIFVCADTEFWSDGHLAFEGEGGEQGIFHVEQGGMLLLDGVTVETTADGGDSQHALWQEEGAGLSLADTFAPCHVSGKIHYAETPLVTEAEDVCVVVEKGGLLDGRMPTEVACAVNYQGARLEREPVAVSWDMAGTEKQQAERRRFQAQGVFPQAADGVKPVCTVVYNDFPLTFTKTEALIRGNAYTFRGDYTKQEGALLAVASPEYSFDGENWISEGENSILSADNGFYIAFPCDQWDASAHPYIYIRLRGDTEEQVYYSNVLRYAANNMDVAEDLGGSRGGGTAIVNPPDDSGEPELPGESEAPEKPNESEKPGESEASGKPNEPEKPAESEKTEKSNESDKTETEAPKKPTEPNQSEQPQKAPEFAVEQFLSTAASGQPEQKNESENKTKQAQFPEEVITAEDTGSSAPDFAAQEMPVDTETNADLASNVQSEFSAENKSGNMMAGQTQNYGLMVGIVVLSAAAGGACFFASNGTKR